MLVHGPCRAVRLCDVHACVRHREPPIVSFLAEGLPASPGTATPWKRSEVAVRALRPANPRPTPGGAGCHSPSRGLEVSRSHQPCWHPCPPEPALHPRGIRHSALRRNNWKTGVAILPGTGPFPWPCAASIQLPEAWDHCPDASGTEKPWQVRPSGRACSSLAGTGLIARDGHPHETPGSRRTDGAGERWQAACGYVVLCHNMQRTCQLMNES